ncbi:hypothetical protein [Nakamurella endophytica]|uniref:Uncharacterized protein n=1 Tax=Nakamurella endophytica TaxID=1748367 RepID=A0A917WGP7_9ACTN|nr:hypothetical protein [Nakamurella endophytica]GGM02710.1 hypothetical protein GCM10011594_23520 [Nakamurella endophytica]
MTSSEPAGSTRQDQTDQAAPVSAGDTARPAGTEPPQRADDDLAPAVESEGGEGAPAGSPRSGGTGGAAEVPAGDSGRSDGGGEDAVTTARSGTTPAPDGSSTPAAGDAVEPTSGSTDTGRDASTGASTDAATAPGSSDRGGTGTQGGAGTSAGGPVGATDDEPADGAQTEQERLAAMVPVDTTQLERADAAIETAKQHAGAALDPDTD